MHEHGGNIYTHVNRIDFSANINPLGMPERVKQAVIDSVCLWEHYPDPDCVELTELIAKKEGVSTASILCGNGAAELIFALVEAIKPRKALVFAPGFYEYEQALHNVGCEILRYGLEEQSGFLVREDVLQWITKDVDMVLFANPNNPTGLLVETDLQKAIVERCNTLGVHLLVDESFLELVTGKKTQSVVPYLQGKQETYNRLYVLKSFTKLYAIPGIRAGYLLGKDETFFLQIRSFLQSWNVSVPAQAAARACLMEHEYVKQSLHYIEKEKAYLWKELSTFKNITIYGGDANFLFWKGSQDFYDAFLKNGFLIRDCSNYMGLTKGFYRIAVRTHEENVAFVACLREICE